jgi:hypothetical protein
MVHLKLLENHEYSNPKTSRRREIKKKGPKLMKEKQQQQQKKLYKESMKQKAGFLKK